MDSIENDEKQGRFGDQPDVPATSQADSAKFKQEAHKPESNERLSAYITIVAAAFGLVSDGYQNNLMSMVNVTFKKLYPQEYTTNASTRVSNALLIGAIIGQVFVGLVCDRLGRKTALVATTFFIIVGSILGTAAHGANGSVNGLFWCLTFSRGITGVGVGGEYPASSTSASEAANEKMITRRGPIFILVTNLALAFGGLLSILVFLIVLSAAGGNRLPTVWRICFGIGIIIPAPIFYFRLRMHSSQLYRRAAIKRRVPYWLTIKRYQKSLIGTCGAWFLYDFVTFPNGVFSATIISTVIHDGEIRHTAEWQLLLSTIALPGVFIGAALCNSFGRRNTMMLGFSGYLVFGLIIGLSYNKIITITPLFVIFFGLMQSSGNLGPGDMLGLVSAESFATPVRGSLYGLSAALGKTGAAVGTQAFAPIQNNLGNRWTFIIAAICGVTGILITHFFVPDMTGIGLAEEDAKFFQYLTENGWEGHVGEDDEGTIVKPCVGIGAGGVIERLNEKA